MKREDIPIRDPYILPYEGKYYMYGTEPKTEDMNNQKRFWCYTSENLQEWEGPVLCFENSEDFWGEREFWAPEVHLYEGKFYMLATFMAEGCMRATQTLVADKPIGPFHVIGEPLTPPDWMCLDGTLYVEDGTPYLVFCHEWLQVGDGEIAMIPLKKDLTGAAGEATVLFKAGDSGWAHAIEVCGARGIVTDGPFLVKDGDKLLMFWSSFLEETSYAVGMAISESGKLKGPWKQLEHLLFEKDGGHGMMFHGFDGRDYFVLHAPNEDLKERANFFEIVRSGEGYCCTMRE